MFHTILQKNNNFFLINFIYLFVCYLYLPLLEARKKWQIKNLCLIVVIVIVAVAIMFKTIKNC